MEWDKSYQDDGFDQEDEYDDLVQGRMTDYEYQQPNAAKADIFKCNIVFRKNLVQVLFCLLLMLICTLQIEAESQFLINQTMRDYIYSLKKVDYATSIKDLTVWSHNRIAGTLQLENDDKLKYNSSKFYHFEDESKKLSLISLDSIKDLNDTYMFLQSIVPRIGQNLNVEAVWNQSTPDIKTKFKAFFINREEYIIGDLIRLSFSINPRNIDFFEEMAEIEKSSKSIYYGEYGDNIFTKDNSALLTAGAVSEYENSVVMDSVMPMFAGNQAASNTVNSTWYKSLIAIPGFLKNEVIGRNETL